LNQTAIMATGESSINEIFSLQLKDLVQPIDNGLFKEDLTTKIEKHKPHILILADGISLLEEEPKRETFIRNLRRLYPGTRIIYIYDSEQVQLPIFLRFLISQQIFDFLSSELDLNELRLLIKSPRLYDDVKHLEQGLGASSSAALEAATTDESPELSLATHPGKAGESRDTLLRDLINKMKPIRIVTEKQGETNYISQKQKTVLFYSNSSTGKSTILQNTGVYLAQKDPDVDIVLFDGDFLQPTLASRMGLTMKNKESRMYFEEVLQKIDGNRFDVDTLDDFLLTHPTYPNLKIFSCEFKKPEFQNFLDTHHVERIFELLKEQFSIILIDTSRDIEIMGTDVCFKKATIIYHVLDYDFSHCMKFQEMRRVFEQIPFIQRKPKKIIINKSVDHPKLKPELIQQFFESRKNDKFPVEDHLDPVPIAVIPMLYTEQLNAILEGFSLVESKSKTVIPFIEAIHSVAVTIHNVNYDQKKPSGFSKLLNKIKRVRSGAERFGRDLEHDDVMEKL
jgi:MinD-like ATPase involved in chromosome partitioning or flagellar assembly